jgi:ABC-type nickel/cobalt efflux system permease component RcnA
VEYRKEYGIVGDENEYNHFAITDYEQESENITGKNNGDRHPMKFNDEDALANVVITLLTDARNKYHEATTGTGRRKRRHTRKHRTKHHVKKTRKRTHKRRTKKKTRRVKKRVRKSRTHKRKSSRHN